MKTYISIALLFLSPLIASAEMKLIGTHLAEFSIFNIDVYQISYFRGPDGTEEMLLDYKTNVKKKYSIMGWEEGLDHVLKKNPEYKPKYDWITSQVVDLRKGDKFVIRKKKNLVTMLKNGKQLAQIDDAVIASMVYEPWIGSDPVDKDLKKDLLKNNGK